MRDMGLDFGYAMARMKSQDSVYDVVVIGGGPSGLMAAGTAAQNGAKVLLLEKNSTCGKKLLLTGNGRCNVTQNQANIRELIKSYGKNGPFLFSCFTAFSPQEVMEFFQNLGVDLKTEELNRVFPISDKATDILESLMLWVKGSGVQIKTKTTVKHVEISDGVFEITTDKEVIKSNNVIVATGGQSYPATGSTGDAFVWVKELGHTVVECVPALVPLKTREAAVHDLKGLSLDDVQISFGKNTTRGSMIFTHFGISGPAVFTVSREVSRSLAHGPVGMSVDLMPDKNATRLGDEMNAFISRSVNKDIKKILLNYFPDRLATAVCRASKIDPTKKAGQCTSKERESLIASMKSFNLTVTQTLGWSTAMVTSGGVSLKEVDPKTMQSKIVPGLFLVGEALDLDGPTGGYNLQIAWSTGHAAGLAASGV